MHKKNSGFTLAEVLITLGIIGVVAAMTIPTLMNQTNDKQTVVALKKAYTNLSQAYTLAINDNDTPENWGLGAPASAIGAENVLNMFAKYLKVAKNCGTTISGCFPDVQYKHLNGTDNWGNLYNPLTWVARAQLADGSLISVESSGNCDNPIPGVNATTCGWIAIDVNGYKNPNRIGADYFFFYYTKDKRIIPFGTPIQTDSTFDNDCNYKNTAHGWACTAWVLLNENQDYLKCPGTLAWTGPTKCQ